MAVLLTGMACSEKKPDSRQKWFKGNLHTHSYWSDGDEFPEVIMDWYKSQGYDFVALSDHNTLAEGEKWKTLSADSVYQKAFEKYLSQYGSEWVQYRKNAQNQTEVKLKTYEEYRKLFEETGDFLIIKSEEITDSFEGKPLHMNASNIQQKIDPQGGSSVVEVLENNINAVQRQSQALQTAMMTVINHPNFYYAIGPQELAALGNGHFFELYNGHHMVNNAGDSTHLSTERLWDYINIAYQKRGQSLMYGLATDDSHHYHRIGPDFSNAGRGWVAVKADSLHPESIVKAMQNGEFYASTGVVLKTVEIRNNQIVIEVEPENDVQYTLYFIGCKKGNIETEILETVQGNRGTFELNKDLLFVRCKIISTQKQQNPVDDGSLETAWTQPVELK